MGACVSLCVDHHCAWGAFTCLSPVICRPGFQKSSAGTCFQKTWCFPLVGSVLKLNWRSVHPSEWFCIQICPDPMSACHCELTPVTGEVFCFPQNKLEPWLGSTSYMLPAESLTASRSVTRASSSPGVLAAMDSWASPL